MGSVGLLKVILLCSCQTLERRTVYSGVIMNGESSTSEGCKPIRVWSVEPLIEELTGPLTLASFGLLFIVIPDFSFGPIGSTQRLGWIGLILAIVGLVVLLVKFLRHSAPSSD